MRILLGITGASGALFPVDFLKRRADNEVYLICSQWGEKLLADELNMTLDEVAALSTRSFGDDDLAAPFSSGSVPFDAMVILPCSASTLGKIASGISDTLITRAAQVALKERRRLVICLRETPLNAIQIENCLKLSRAGADIVPIIPSFYHKPKSIAEMAAHFNDRVMALIGAGAAKPWREDEL